MIYAITMSRINQYNSMETINKSYFITSLQPLDIPLTPLQSHFQLVLCLSLFGWCKMEMANQSKFTMILTIMHI